MSFITRCPHCATAFNVTDAQLRAAQGSVRCGSCLTIFNGQVHLISGDFTSAQAANTSSKSASPPPRAQAPARTPTSATTRTPPPPSTHPQSALSLDDAVDDDESWALKLLEDDDNELPSPVTKSPVKPAQTGTRLPPQAASSPNLKTLDTGTSSVRRIARESLSTPPAINAEPIEAPVTAKPAATRPRATVPPTAASNLTTASAATTATAPTSATASRPAAPNSATVASRPVTATPQPTQRAPTTQTAVAKPAAADKRPESPAVPEPASLTRAAPPSRQAAPAAAAPSQARAATVASRPTGDATGHSSSASQQAARYAAEKAGQEQALPSGADALFDAAALAELEKTLQDSLKQTVPMAPSLPPAPAAPDAASPPAAPDNTQAAPVKTADTPEPHLPPSNSPSQPLLAGIEADSLEIRLPQPGPSVGQRLLWTLLATAGGLVLCVQVAWLKFDQWSLKPELRHYYQQVCDRLGCQLPDRRDISLIRTSNLSVRQHPTIAGALLVDVVLRNHATFAQPFPRLNMVFSNHRDKVLASRSFEPGEYLGGDLTGAQLMPPDQSIHLSLELVDPGQGAVSYKITLSDL